MSYIFEKETTKTYGNEKNSRIRKKLIKPNYKDKILGLNNTT